MTKDQILRMAKRFDLHRVSFGRFRLAQLRAKQVNEARAKKLKLLGRMPRAEIIHTLQRRSEARLLARYGGKRDVERNLKARFGESATLPEPALEQDREITVDAKKLKPIRQVFKQFNIEKGKVLPKKRKVKLREKEKGPKRRKSYKLMVDQNFINYLGNRYEPMPYY